MPEIDPKNITAQLSYLGRGNSPATHLASAISNCFPGLEFDFRAVWKRFFVGIELHEADNLVLAVQADSSAAQQGIAAGDRLVEVDGRPVTAPVVGPTQVGGAAVTLAPSEHLEWSNALADTAASMPGRQVSCRFEGRGGASKSAVLETRPLFEGVALTEEVAEPGALTQGLCSPWQSDYRECGCYYWAASRPDFVNTEEPTPGQVRGDNWMTKARGPAGSKAYAPDDPSDPGQWTYEDLYRDWERLRFQVGGQDET
jgi:hypothetical protein